MEIYGGGSFIDQDSGPSYWKDIGWEGERPGRKKKSEPLINILIRNESRAVYFVSLTVMIFRDNAAAKFRMSNNTRVYEKGPRTTRGRVMWKLYELCVDVRCELSATSNDVYNSKTCYNKMLIIFCEIKHEVMYISWQNLIFFKIFFKSAFRKKAVI